jgi:threonine/homoserine/homoserine lactone efflux protein
MFGIESGEMVWIAAAATGIAALIEASSGALTLLRFGGAAYLIYLGVRRWRQVEPFGSAQPASLARVFAQGFLTQILNPKVAVFFVAFLPLFVDPSMAVLPQVLVLGAVYVAVALVVDSSYVLGLAALSRRWMSSRTAQRRSGRFAAGTYVALGVAAAVSGERLSA